MNWPSGPVLRWSWLLDRADPFDAAAARAGYGDASDVAIKAEKVAPKHRASPSGRTEWAEKEAFYEYAQVLSETE